MLYTIPHKTSGHCEHLFLAQLIDLNTQANATTEQKRINAGCVQIYQTVGVACHFHGTSATIRGRSLRLAFHMHA